MNRLKPIKAKIKDIRKETEDVRTYILSIKKTFTARPGQFNMVGYPGVGEAPVSFSSVIHDNCFEHTIRAVGRVTRFLDRLKKGNEIFLRGPYGRGWPINEAKDKDILLVAGGLGIAPVRPVVQMILNNRELFGDASLIYGARNEENVLFMNEYKKWGKRISLHLTVDEVSQPPRNKRGGKEGVTLEKGGNKKRVPLSKVVSRRGWKYNVGLVTELLDKVKINPERTIVFVCGPEIMMRFVCRELLMLGVQESRMYVSLERRMKCGVAHCGHCQHYGLFVCRDGPVFSYNEVKGLPDGLL
jgi:NAD(P)H-flavin reductase